ncbi:hypothetical protein [Oceanobacillus sp. J11TS1]|uniref:hypothetical protein n=1 Tax=Oceanobacillus sp. J11TS1 TaxID=2807191 RepID=UPI001B139C94|nr:hypothetical protein [Oceanobacillus sp. J11TS1]GIO22886.1 hypothetical protein J11TS1_14670 [Oceanobacillus sp. J11TS1]
MKEAILVLVDIINNLHDIIAATFGMDMTDKQLHFWIFGILGMITFLFVYIVFKIISKMKWSIAIFAFLYSFTVMVVLAFAVEIQQAYTQRGNMEFADAVMGLWGFIVFFAVYAVIGIIGYFIYQAFKK